MKRVIATERIPIKMWLDEIEDTALEQARNLANLPFAVRHIALMPDCHSGYGMPIGGVLATIKVIVPNAVGVDIGCGMLAVKTGMNDPEKSVIEDLIDIIKQRIPVGFNWHEKQVDNSNMPVSQKGEKIILKEREKARYQLGTLGGGNHFIELQSDEDGFIWIMIHSGSRNLGKQVADHYNKVAIEENKRWFSSVPPEHQLGFLSFDTMEAGDYWDEMQYCVAFAKANRAMMLELVKSVFEEVLGFDENDYADVIDIAHNYAAWENHYGQNVIVHRKGATRAYAGEIGIIPGSQGTKSYIVRGLGDPESFMSCSHGAGRIMGRKQARRELDLEREIANLNDKGIIHSIESVDDLDEAPSAYKNIDQVMENQSDLIEIVHELTPLAVIKGQGVKRWIKN